MTFQVITDGSVDLDEKLIDAHHILVLPFYISIDTEKYLKERTEIKTLEIYERMEKDPTLFPKTSRITYQDYYEIFKNTAEKGLDMIYISLSTKFTKSNESAYMAAQDVLTKYPERKIEILDSMLATCVQGLFVLEAARMSENNLDLFTARTELEKIRKTGNIYFMVGNLDYLRKGGRIGKLKGVIGATLKVKPIIGLGDGELYSLGVAFTKAQGIAKIVTFFKKYFSNPENNIQDYLFVIGSGIDTEDGKLLYEKFTQMYPDASFMLGQIGATIGVHTGPHPLGVGFIKKYDA